MNERVLQATESSLDDQPIEKWLRSANTRPNRRACLLNLLAKLRTAPDVKTPVIGEVRNVSFAGTGAMKDFLYYTTASA